MSAFSHSGSESNASDFAEMHESEIRSLETRVRILEAALACISHEADAPLQHPELSFMAVQRIAAVTRQALMSVPKARFRDGAAPISHERPLAPLATTRGRARR